MPLETEQEEVTQEEVTEEEIEEEIEDTKRCVTAQKDAPNAPYAC